MVQLQRSSSGGDIHNDHFVEFLLREDIQIPFTFQESRWKNVISAGPSLVRRCDGPGDNTSMVNAN